MKVPFYTCNFVDELNEDAHRVVRRIVKAMAGPVAKRGRGGSGRGRPGGHGRGRGGHGRGRGGSRGGGRSTSNPRIGRKGAPVIYDGDAHTDFVTGFRRRKQARRLEAAGAAAIAERESIREARREKRAVLRDAARAARGDVEGGSGDEAEEGAEITEYAGADSDANVTVTTTVSRIATAADTSFIKSSIGAPAKREYSRQNPLPKYVKPKLSLVKAKLKKKVAKGSRSRGIDKAKGKKGRGRQSRLET